MAQQALAMPVGQILMATFAFDLPPRKLTNVRTAYTVRLAEGTFGLIAPMGDVSLQGIDVKLSLVPSDFRGNLEILLENRRSLPFHVDVGQTLAQFIVMPLCPLTG